ncbi:hypothetical protein R1sor_019692 [Riccia sorocarpa]|uniref:O-methyltransferase n=1 Tax=Riccia sorocarpa TaxID=122646 RepID=A0ABD3ID89_9MARC
MVQSMNEIREEDDDCMGQIRALHLSHTPVVLPFAVKALIELGVPEILVDAGPHVELTAAEIASRIETPTRRAADSENLDRLLALLASHNFLRVSVDSENPDKRKYAITSAGGLKYFVKNDTKSLAPLLMVQLEPDSLLPYRYLHETVLDPSTWPTIRAFGMHYWEHSEKYPEFAAMFNRGMAGSSSSLMSSLLEKYDGFEGLGSLVDVGGGTGETLALIVSKYPQLRGINFDQPHVVATGVRVPGIKHVGGNFFETCPQGDAVFMKWIMHDWSDEKCVSILKNVYKALPPQGKVINIDVLLPEVIDSSFKSQAGFETDVMMLTFLQGRERNLSRFRKIVTDAGFMRVEIMATVFGQTVLEFHKN